MAMIDTSRYYNDWHSPYPYYHRGPRQHHDVAAVANERLQQQQQEEVEPLYFVAIDTRGLPATDLQEGLNELACPKHYFLTNVVNDPYTKCIICPLAETCGLSKHLKIYFRDYYLGQGSFSSFYSSSSPLQQDKTATTTMTTTSSQEQNDDYIDDDDTQKHKNTRGASTITSSDSSVDTDSTATATSTAPGSKIDVELAWSEFFPLGQNNPGATLLTMDHSNGCARYNVQGVAYAVYDDGRYPISKEQVWGLCEMANAAKDVYFCNIHETEKKKRAAGPSLLSRWCSLYRKRQWGSPNIYQPRSDTIQRGRPLHR